jgi:purine-cytosine permease-like protein
MMLMWFSMLMSPGLITMGILGPIFGLSVNTSAILTVFASCIGSVIPAFTATLSAPTGLRQIAVSRYAFGIWGSKFCGLLNIIVNIGFGTVNCIVAGQLISAVSDGSVSVVLGIIIVVVISFIISFFGYHAIHRYDQVAWILIFVFLCVEFGQSAKYFSPTPGLSSVSGLDYTGSCLTYFAIIFGESAAWCSLTGDYYVHYPPNTSKWLVFGMTWTGLTLPTIFVLLLGNYYGGIINTDEIMSNIYNEGGIGALIVATMRPSGWAKFVSVLYALSFSMSTMHPFSSPSRC